MLETDRIPLLHMSTPTSLLPLLLGVEDRHLLQEGNSTATLPRRHDTMGHRQAPPTATIADLHRINNPMEIIQGHNIRHPVDSMGLRRGIQTRIGTATTEHQILITLIKGISMEDGVDTTGERKHCEMISGRLCSIENIHLKACIIVCRVD